MEGPSGAAAAQPLARSFSQVVFNNIPQSYPPSTSLTCHYTASFQPHPRDWVGIFKVGWNSAKDYHTFVWVEPCLDVVGQESVTRQTLFKDYYLPKDEMEFYQFCYIDVTGQVRGASTPFCFKSPEEQSLTSRLDDDILVVTTQEQVDQSVRERDELQKELDQIRQENETLKSALEKERQDAAVFKEQNEEKESEKSHLVEEMGQIKEEMGNLKSTLQQKLQEIDTLKEELLVQTTQQLELEQHRATEQKELSRSSDRAAAENEKHTQEKYDRAVLKINQMKDEHKALKGTIEAQSQDIAKLNCKLREGQRELFKTEDSIQLLQVDLQSSDTQKDRLDAELQRVTLNMEDLKRENQELCRRLTQQGTQQESPDDLASTGGPLQALVSQLQEAQVKLATERDETRNTKRQVVALNEELTNVKRQLDNVVMACDEDRRKSNKFELQLREALEAVADKDGLIEENEHMMRLVKHENEDLTRENNNLRSNMEGLRSAYADLNAPTSDSSHGQPDSTSPAGNTSTIPAPDPTEHPYEVIEDVAEPEEGQLLMCRHCHESFPGITRGELEQHEASHRVCPFCTVICDHMEQSVFEDHVYSHEL
ncbi:calcium-binding and coiled-coil domain-containing protein 2 isoform X1 [Hippoglossus hippoglossus]|uniref:calcium-binding and coiled-coil domain-containing protein 2 isoform X1 n=1 Tax=Hippoglossus hippoglossus TaxID=8267 RepID=UPI00148E6ED6|nr:calcium-binding and coiled-coil domain-containing protein 2 isoform X1 [Hippoglossus hippoglossus]XP_034426456.1 calcium-binding and coiled-coil domain-containing protein 2 isoform X1 [Hippoglossus hippoglossus]XP_034426457.1 calcium-binding and coiled-coil domain-containing protein 2 isoform X1 [Hippoglossus hippoglossus]